MADSIKKQVMDALKAGFTTIPEIGSVHRWHGKPIDLDTVKVPALFFFDADETREKRNRLAVGVISLHLWIFIPLAPSGQVSFNDRADQIQGQVHNTLINLTTLKGLVEQIDEVKIWKEFPNDIWGVLMLSFDLRYMHAYGDAFSRTY